MVKIDGLAKEIAKNLQTYTTEVEKELRSAENKITREAMEEIKAHSPVGHSQGKKYAEGWARKRHDTSIEIYNKNKPSLTHLLEKGHASVNGGFVPGKPHILPAEQRAIKKYLAAVEKAVKP